MEREGFVVAAIRLRSELRGKENFHLRFGERGLTGRSRNKHKFLHRVWQGGFVRWLGQCATVLHFSNGFRESAHDMLKVIVRVLGGEETRKSFEQVNAFFAQVIIEEASETEIHGKAKIKNAGKIFYERGDLIVFKKRVEALDQSGGAFAEALFRPGPCSFRYLRTARQAAIVSGWRTKVPAKN